MKIAVFHNIPSGGAKRTIYEQVKYLSKNNHIDIYSFDTNKEKYWSLEKFASNNFIFSYPKFISGINSINRIACDFINLFSSRKVHKKMAGLINNGHYDCVLVHLDVNLEAPYLLRYLKVPSLYFAQEYYRLVYEPQYHPLEGYKLYEKIYRYLLKINEEKNVKSSTIIATSSLFMANKIKNSYRISPKVCHLGVDASVFRQSAKKRKDQVLLIGDKNIIKGNDFADNIKKRLAKFRIRVIRYKTSGTMTEADDIKLARAYSESISTLCLGRNEPFGLSAIESMACETPVLAVDEGGYKETVVNKVNGYLLKRNVNEFVKNIIKLKKDIKLANKLGKNGRKMVIDNFSWEKHNLIIENILKNITL